MVLTRGNKDNEDSESRSELPHRQCRRSRTTLQEPEDEMFWESDDNIIEPRRITRSVVTFQGKNLSNSEKASSHSSMLLNSLTDEVAIEGDTDTDDEFFIRENRVRSEQSHRISLSRSDRRINNLSPIKKEYILDVHGDISDQETGLRRSSRRKGNHKGPSWLFGEKKLRGYPNMIHSSEPENEDQRPSRKPHRNLRTSNKKSDSSSPPHTRSLQYRNESSHRGLNYLHCNSRRASHKRLRRRPIRYRDHYGGDGAGYDVDEDDDDDNNEEDDINMQDNEDEVDENNIDDSDITEIKEKCKNDINNGMMKVVEKDGNHKSDVEDMKLIDGIKSRQKMIKARTRSREIGRLAIDNYDPCFERSKRERKPVSRLMYTRSFTSRSSRPSYSSEEVEEDDDELKSDEQIPNRYSLREKRKAPMPDSYEPAINHRHRIRDQFLSSPARKIVFNKHRQRATHASSTSSSDEEVQFEKRKAKSMVKARSRCLPMNLKADDIATGIIRERSKIGSSLADIDPMSIDNSVTFESIGGLAQHVKSLKEMIIFPLMYPEVFLKFNSSPPRGVLFHGPPGTGKTLVARALANECSQSDKKVAFFMRKGADCLSKWVGESERQLRLLFDQAYQMRPSIIFFDEIDGLAPVRSSRQDQIHSSIVSTLLALMDGLDSRGEVVVIGATNRIDAIDPALRRPGRFDREFHFSIPSIEARKKILTIHTAKWDPPPSGHLLKLLSERTVSYCGADLKALCAEATLNALRGQYPQIYTSKHKLLLDVSKIKVRLVHFQQALSKIVPAGQRASSTSSSRKLCVAIDPLMRPCLREVLRKLRQRFSRGFKKSLSHIELHRPRMLITGSKGQGHTTHLAPAILHALEKINTHKLDLPTLFSVSTRAPEEACAQVFHEARRNPPSIIYLPMIDKWWSTVNDTVQATFLSLLNDLEPSASILLLVTSDTSYNQLDYEIQNLFSVYRDEIYTMSDPQEKCRQNFFRPPFFTMVPRKPKVMKLKHRVLEELPIAPPPEPRKLSINELHKVEMGEEASLRELRIFLRQICAKLAKNRMFYIFTKPVDIDEVSDYKEVITVPMDLETMMTKIDKHQYECAEDFLKDIDLICSNALEYNPDRNPDDKIIRHRACTLRDTAYAYIKAEMDTDFEDKCQEIRKVRKRRKQPSVSCPDFIKAELSSNKLHLAAEPVHNIKQPPITLNKSPDSKLKSLLDSGRRRKRRGNSRWARGMVSTKKKRVDKDEDKSKEEEKKVSCKSNEFREDVDDSKEDHDREESQNENRERESTIDSFERHEDNIDYITKEKIIVESSFELCNGNVSADDSMNVSSAADLLYKNSLKEAIQKENIDESMNLVVISNANKEEAIVSYSDPGCSQEKKDGVVIDWSHLEAVFESCVSATVGSAVEELHYLYTVIVALAHKHNSSLDRSQLLNDIEAEIRKFAQYKNKLQ